MHEVNAAPGEATEERILAAAEGLFSRQGFRATGLRQVAAAAGVAVGTVYTRFPHKQALLAALLSRAAGRLRRGLAWVWLTPGLPAAERWSRFRRALLEVLPWLACEEEARGEQRTRAGAAGGLQAGEDETPGSVAREALARLLEEASRRGEIRLPLPDPGATADALLAAATGMWRAGYPEALDVLWWGLAAVEATNGAPRGPGAGAAAPQVSRNMPESTWCRTQ